MVKIQTMTLKRQQKEQLEAMLEKYRWSPREIGRAQGLLTVNNNTQISNNEIGQTLSPARDTVRIIRKRFKEKRT